ncbi:MAG: FtsX-like permease family protein [Desulfurococcaceae archaeon]
MLLRDVLRLSLKALTEKRARALLTIIGVAIGPMALVSIYGVTNSYGNYIVGQIQGLGQNVIVVFPSNGYRLGDSDLNTIKSIDGVEDARPFVSLQGLIRQGPQSKAVFIYCIDPEFIFKALPSLQLSEGSLPSQYAIGAAVVGYNVAYGSDGTKYYGLGDSVSITFQDPSTGKVKHASVVVNGLLSKYGGAAVLSPDDTIFVTFPSASSLFGVRDWSGILVIAKDPSYVEGIEGRLREDYGNRVDVVTFLGIARIASSIIGAVNFVTFAASLSAFGVAVVGVAATMITSVMERTREIGVMKALGFTNGQVVIMILAEGVLIGLIGSAVGISLGYAGAQLLSMHGFSITGTTFRWSVRVTPTYTPEFMAEVLALTLFTGLGGAALPAYRASRIPPAVALRYE